MKCVKFNTNFLIVFNKVIKRISGMKKKEDLNRTNKHYKKVNDKKCKNVKM